MAKAKEFDKYFYYESAVQNPSNEVEFFTEKYQEIRKKKATTLREDFCGTAAICCEWVKQSDDHQAWGIDLDLEPLVYGQENHKSKLTEDQKSRVQYIEGNVLDTPIPNKVDICFAFNFSYFIFKQRQQLKEYFQAAYEAINSDGIFFIDLFGGPDSQTEMTDVIEHKGFKYYWECQKFNPLNNNCRFAIHFKRKGEKKREDVFVYDWRMWFSSELADLLKEVGFKEVITYWEGEDEDGDGDGEFYAATEEENCEAWVTYLAAVK